MTAIILMTKKHFPSQEIIESERQIMAMKNENGMNIIECLHLNGYDTTGPGALIWCPGTSKTNFVKTLIQCISCNASF